MLRQTSFSWPAAFSTAPLGQWYRLVGARKAAIITCERFLNGTVRACLAEIHRRCGGSRYLIRCRNGLLSIARASCSTSNGLPSMNAAPRRQRQILPDSSCTASIASNICRQRLETHTENRALQSSAEKDHWLCPGGEPQTALYGKL